MAALWPSMVCYPEPQATHEEVIADRDLFQSTLEGLLSHLNIKLKIPKVSGTEVDLHLLYKEVTNLGGVDLVISRKQWVIVCEPFNFPASFTNKSFVIKKLYINALYHYEQVYYHRRRTPPHMPMPSGDVVSTDTRMLKRKAEFQSESGPIAIVPGHSSSSGSPSAPSGLEAGTRFAGVIDCNFEHGYMITLNLPNQKLQGILYKQAQPHMMPPGVPSLGRTREDTAVSEELESGMDTTKRIRVSGPNPPRPARTPFQFFQLGVNKDQLLQLHPDPTTANAKDVLPKLMSDLWHQMTPEQRHPFLEMGDKDKARYEKEWNDYCHRMQSSGSPGDLEEAPEARRRGLGAGPSSAGTPSTSAGPSNAAGGPGAPKRPPYPRQIRIGVPLKPRTITLPSHLGLPPLPPPSHPHAYPPPSHVPHLMSSPMSHHHHHAPAHGYPFPGHRTSSMPPPRPGSVMTADPSASRQSGGGYDLPRAPRPLPPRIASAPGFHLLPADMEPEDLEHLCYYPSLEDEHHHHPHAFHMDHHMLDHPLHEDPAAHLLHMPDGRHGTPSDPSLGLPPAMPPPGGLSAHHMHQERHHSGATRAAADAFGLSMEGLHDHDAAAAAAAAACNDIDLFGCSTTIQVNSGAGVGIKAEPGSAPPSASNTPVKPQAGGAEAVAQANVHNHTHTMSGQDIASTAGSPSDQPASHSYHGAQNFVLPPGSKYGGMYESGGDGSGRYQEDHNHHRHHHHQVGELLDNDHDVHTLPHMFD